MRRLFDQIHFLQPAETFDLDFPFQGGAVVRARFFIDQRYRFAGAGVTAFAGMVVLMDPPAYVGGDTGVQGLIAALRDVNKPVLVVQEFFHYNTTFL